MESLEFQQLLDNTITVLSGKDIVWQRHSGGSLLSHLIGTFDIVQRWGRPQYTQLAALTHSAYASDSRAFSIFSSSQRTQLVSLIGARAEKMVWTFSNTNVYKFLESSVSEMNSGNECLELAHIYSANILEPVLSGHSSLIPQYLPVLEKLSQIAGIDVIRELKHIKANC